MRTTFDLDLVGRPSAPHRFAVTQERIAAFAEATNDPRPAHREGRLAPPVFAVVPASEAGSEAVLAVIPEPLLGRVVHGQQELRFAAPIVPGMVLTTVATVVGVHARSSGVVVTVRTASTDDSGALVVEGWMTMVVRGAEVEESRGTLAPDHALDAAVREEAPRDRVPATFDADQTVRYAAASGDPMRIHLDDDFARSVGLPGIIVHGLCTLAFASWAVAPRGRVTRLAVRFSGIVRPEQTVTTAIWDGPADGDRRTVRFEMTDEAGGLVVRDGLAEVVDEPDAA